MKKTGIFLILFFVANTISLWLLSKADFAEVAAHWLKSLGQLTGLIGAVLISLEFLLSARIGFVEGLFGGLDKVYKAHAWLGALSFIMILNHPLFLAVNVLPSHKAALNYLLPGNNLSYNFGLFALYLMLVLGFFTLYAKLPYHIWKITHILMVGPLVLTIFHMVYINSDISSDLPLRIWMIGLGSISLLAYFYKRFLYPYLGPKYSYEVQAISQAGDVVEMIMRPKGRKLNFLPGQFVFISIQDEVLGKEEHPFSISSDPSEQNLRLSIKSLGDFTKKLSLLKKGTPVHVYGPYGSLGEKALLSRKDNVWVAGGIGITPFLSLLSYHSRHKIDKNIWLFYSTKTADEALYSQEIMAQTRENPLIKFFNQPSKEKGRLNAKVIAGQVKQMNDKLFIMCGPKTMMDDLSEQLVELGVHPKNIVFEEFNFI